MEIYEDEKNYIQVFKYYEGGSLRNVMQNTDIFTKDEIKYIIKQLLESKLILKLLFPF